MRSWLAGILLTLALPVARADGAAGQRLEFPLRGKTLVLTIYRPASPPKGTIIMGSGDVGWVGLGVTMAEFLSNQGYIVAGFNVRQYLSSFTAAKIHLQTVEPPADYEAMAEHLRRNGLLQRPVILSGVSEGAALAVLAAASPKNHAWASGVITMGLPGSAELAWRWTDFTAWITKSDAREPSFAPNDFIAAVSPLPLYMLQSIKDEYVPPADYRLFDATAKPPKKLVLIDASNHRFTDRRKQLHEAYLAGLAWIDSFKPPS